jgi:acyl-CoA reductase-like NAD-dependent aldehyde dehydrogenase
MPGDPFAPRSDERNVGGVRGRLPSGTQPTPDTPLEQIPAILGRARRAQLQWAGLSFAERRRHVDRMRQYICDNAEAIAALVSRCNGKTRTDALATEVIPCTLACRWYGDNAEKILAPRARHAESVLFAGKRSRILRVPLGVVAIISPWNYPLSIPFGEVVMGLMAGNAILLKVAPATLLVGELISSIMSAGELPEGLFHHLVGPGEALSAALFAQGIGKLFFTGSVATGKRLMAQAAATLTPLSLELGGKDAAIVLEDADIERATSGIAWAGYQNAGQSCAGIERVYVHESIYSAFMELLAQKTSALRHGTAAEGFGVDLGAMTTPSQCAFVERQVADAVAQGARIVAQSSRAGSEEGHHFPATLLTNVDHSMALMREETFGPVLPVMTFGDEEEAIRLANDCSMALTASVWTRNVERGRRLAMRVDAGVSTVNDHLYTHGLSELPWGGPKQSALGRTHGPEGLLEMTEPKCINWGLLDGKRELWWYPHDAETHAALLAALRLANARSPLEWLRAVLRVVPVWLRKTFSPWRPERSLPSPATGSSAPFSAS